MIKWLAVINVIGVLLMILAGFMLMLVPYSLFIASGDYDSLALSGLITALTGLLSYFSTRKSNMDIGKREGFLIVAFGWLAISLYSSLPYYVHGIMPSFTDAVFESVSGLTTTGATIIQDIEVSPHGILLWRSLTQWLGGMGIIVLTIAILPLLNIGGVELFVAESPGPTSNKIHPRIKETAKRLWLIYIGLTIVLMVVLKLLGMTFFDAINHALTTMATGGFSTKNDSIAHFDSVAIHYAITFFMLFGGINYTIIYFMLRGKFKNVWGSEEFKMYLSVLVALIFFVTIGVYHVSDLGLEASFRQASFQLIAMVTTTGFVLSDYTAWSPAITIVFFMTMFIGGCAGSTSGGIKIIRHLVFFKNSILELKRLLHPNALIRIKLDKKIVRPKVLTHILVFLLLYLFLFIVGSVAMTFIFQDFDTPIITAIGSVATSLGNVGPGIGELGPLDNFAKVPCLGKWVLIFLMLLGRLEIFTILILFTPFFWRQN